MRTQFIWMVFWLFSYFSLAEALPKKHKRSLIHTKKHKAQVEKNGFSISHKPTRLPSSEQVILTFDDGPDVTKTPRVLDLLDRYGYKAIFFVNGVRFENNVKAQEILKEIVRRGHFIGNHTIHHDDRLCIRDESRIREEIEKNARMIEEVVGSPPIFFRAPYGTLCKKVKNILAELHISHTSWDVDPQDWKWRDSQKNLAAIQQELAQLRHQKKPLIILLHDIHEETIQTLPPLFEWFQTQPYLHVVHPFKLLPEPSLFLLSQEVGGLLKEGFLFLKMRLQPFFSSSL